jgi:hypothetical protein
MGTPAAHEAPFALDGTVSRDKLLELLDVQTELPWLDYKRDCDLSGAQGLVELAKDVGAMSILGGYLVVGADDRGAPVGLPPGRSALFDEAALSSKVAKYLPAGFELRSAVHDLRDNTVSRSVALVWVAPHPDGWCVFTRDGDCTDQTGKSRIAFRAGAVYARHGTRSEPWGQVDISSARSQLVGRAKDAWRAEHAEETRLALQTALSGAAVVAAPSATFTWQLDAASFEAAVVELLRHDDDIPVRRMLRTAAAEAQRLVAIEGDASDADLKVVLDRIGALAALALDLHRPAYFTLAVRTFLDMYSWGIAEQRVQSSRHQLVPVFWLRIAERLYALGGLAVRLRDWQAVRELALAPVPALERESPGRTWHRDALTQASRANLFSRRLPDGRVQELWLILFARAVVVDQPALRPDLHGDVPTEHGGDDPLLTSLCEFDLLVSVITGTRAGVVTETDLLSVSYPNYARASGWRANAIVPTLIFDAGARQALVPGASDRQLALVLRLADRIAQSEGRGYFGWTGYTDGAVSVFISRHTDA